jgi:hypothetical protein
MKRTHFFPTLGIVSAAPQKDLDLQALPPSGVADTILLNENAYETAPGYMEKVSPAGGRLW